MNNFEFLNSIVPVEIVKEYKPKGKVATPKNPEGMKVRVFKDGAVFPSVELVERFNLEYGSENANGFDVIDSREWGQMPKVDGNGEAIPAMLFFAAVNKDLPKVDLFGAAKLEDASVLTQGAKRPELVEKLREIFNLNVVTIDQDVSDISEVQYFDNLFLDKNYVDLEINIKTSIFEGLPNYFVPKKVAKGPKQGSMTYETRHGLVINPVVVCRD